jgi:hypothetical protein
MTQQVRSPRVLTLALTILSGVMFVIAALGDAGSPLYVDGLGQFPLSIICFVGGVAVGVSAAVLASGSALSAARARVVPRVLAQVIIGVSSFITWFWLAGLAISYGINDGMFRCYLSADGTCDGPVPFDWTPYLIAGTSVVLFFVATVIYLSGAARAHISRADRVLAVVVMALSTVPLGNIVAALWLLRSGYPTSAESVASAL